MEYMDLKEFVQKGYLQELNRNFLHPLGLALEVESCSNGHYELSGVQDHRDDLEGVCYPEISGDMQEKYYYMLQEWDRRLEARTNGLGYMVQPMPDP